MTPVPDDILGEVGCLECDRGKVGKVRRLRKSLYEPRAVGQPLDARHDPHLGPERRS